MNAIDGTEHYDKAAEGSAPSLLVLILDTNPHAWSLHSPKLSLLKVVAELLIFVNVHLAFNQSNRVAIIASHCQRTAWLYPTPENNSRYGDVVGDDTEVEDAASRNTSTNKYRPFALVEREVMTNLRKLMASTTSEDLRLTTTTMIAGALTLALSYINRVGLSLAPANMTGTTTVTSAPLEMAGSASLQNSTTLNSSILIVSTSGDLASQYIPLMNLTFAAQHSRIPIDVLKLAGDTVLLQQASYTTAGIFLIPSSNSAPPNTSMRLLPTLLFAYLPDAAARAHLILPTSSQIDFRAACFCHRRVVDLGFVCSICLSIFCVDALPLPDSCCLTCGTKLRVDVSASMDGNQSGARKKAKRKVADKVPPAAVE